MSHREDGEFELILGNKQLLSVLGVVIILLGVFFAMGFLAGRSTGPAVAAKTKAGEPPTLIESAAKPSAATPAVSAPAPETAPPSPVETRPAEPQPPRPVTEAKQEAPQPPEPKRQTAAAPPAAPAASADGYYETAPKGTYLQVAATRRADALNTRSLLLKAGLPAILTPSAKPELVRVLVGPIPDAETVARYREELKKVGIGSPIVAKY